MIGSFATAIVLLLVAYNTFVGDWAVLRSKSDKDHSKAIEQLRLKDAELHGRLRAVENKIDEHHAEQIKKLDYLVKQVDKLRDARSP